MVSDTVVARARHMQAAHRDKNRLIGMASSGVEVPVIYGSVAAAETNVNAPLMADADDGDGGLPALVDDDEAGYGVAPQDRQAKRRTSARAARASAIVASRRGDGMERGVLGRAACRHRNVYWTSAAARIRAYYEALPEASQSVPLVDPALRDRPSRFDSPALRGTLRFSLTAGGSGLSECDNLRFAEAVLALEAAATESTHVVGAFADHFQAPHSFLYATREEQARVLERLR